jgi:hypothetical protein
VARVVASGLRLNGNRDSGRCDRHRVDVSSTAHPSECRKLHPSARSGASARWTASSERAPTRLLRARESQWRAEAPSTTAGPRGVGTVTVSVRDRSARHHAPAMLRLVARVETSACRESWHLGATTPTSQAGWLASRRDSQPGVQYLTRERRRPGPPPRASSLPAETLPSTTTSPRPPCRPDRGPRRRAPRRPHVWTRPARAAGGRSRNRTPARQDALLGV